MGYKIKEKYGECILHSLNLEKLLDSYWHSKRKTLEDFLKDLLFSEECIDMGFYLAINSSLIMSLV